MRAIHLLTLTLAITIYSVEHIQGAKILAIFNLNVKSHFFMFETLLKRLAERGHQVYVAGHFPLNKPIRNYVDISVEGSVPALFNNFTIEYGRSLGYWNLWHFIFIHTVEMCETMLQQPQMQEIISGEHKFDLVITEPFGPDCFAGLAHKYNAPLINILSSVALPWVNDRIGNPDNPSYIPNYFLPYSDKMNFFQRVINLMFTEGLKLGEYYFGELAMDELGRKYYGADLPPLSTLKKRTSMLFLNSHFSLNIPRPVVPSFIEVGGLHIRPGGKLPKDIETFMNEAKRGVIYFSLGSLVRGETLPKETIQMFINVFSKLPQRVLWKIDGIGGLPSNVKISQWLPQFEILSHPNIELFITHGGLMGVQEGVYAGVPMIGIPLFADQQHNIENCVSKGMAEMVDYDFLSEETMMNALSTVLNNTSYKTNAKQLSTLFKDRPQTALETAIFWTEYVIRHKGAPHLKSAAVDLPFHQYLLLDVLAVILLGVCVTALLLFLIIYKIYTVFFKSKPKKLKSS